MKAPKYSFVVPVLNGEKTLAGTLRSIRAQTFQDFELIVVDNGSTDQTKRIARGFSDRYIYLSERSRSKARNRGAKAAKGTYLAFVDADVILDPNWLKNADLYLKKIPLDALATKILPKAEQKSALDSYRIEFARWKSQNTFLSVLQPTRPLPLINTAACLMRRASFFQVGAFDPRLKRHEDFELSLRLFLRGFALGGTTSAQAEVRFTAERGLPGARELSYLYRIFEVQYLALFPRRGINWPLLKFLRNESPQARLLGYAGLVEGARLLGALARTSLPPPSPSKRKGSPSNALTYSFSRNKRLYFLRRDFNFLFVDREVYAMRGIDEFQNLKRPYADQVKKIFRGKKLNFKDSKALLEMGIFEEVAGRSLAQQ